MPNRSPRGTKRAPRAPRRKESAKEPLAEVVPGSVPDEPEGVVVPRIDPPHLLAVCRGCGRISALSLDAEEVGLLAGFAGKAPEGWIVDGLSLTLTATCRRCREGPVG
ncbi:MAG TPA: hypothetical protein VGU43_01140 [Thermoplasmata archaeon]|nr:hypothetical protein [Thermoplasmata archaeon]